MTDPLPDDLCTLTTAARLIPGRKQGKPLGVATLHRWARYGVRGVRLRTVLVGGHRLTTRRWLAEFYAAGNGQPAPVNLAVATEAEARLIAMGA